MQETESIDEYILQHIDAESDYLKALYRDTHAENVCGDDSPPAYTGDRNV